VIDLCATLFDWAKFRRTKGAVTLHCLLDHDGDLPSVVVMDRGHVDDAWFGQWTAHEVFFVTRLKDKAVYTVVERRRVPERSAIVRDEVIQLTGGTAATTCPHRLRRVEADDPEKHGTLVFLTNRLAFGATTIAAIDKDRWQIELCFKALKQNLKIKTFVGTSANALKVQVWTALTAISGRGSISRLKARPRSSSPRWGRWTLANRGSRTRQPDPAPPDLVQFPRNPHGFRAGSRLTWTAVVTGTGAGGC